MTDLKAYTEAKDRVERFLAGNSETFWDVERLRLAAVKRARKAARLSALQTKEPR